MSTDDLPAGARAPSGPTERRRGGDRRSGRERRRRDVPVEVERRSGVDRRTVPDRRAGAYDLDADTVEFLRAVGEFKSRTGKAFPSFSEMLQILRGLGWSKGPRPGA
jgi:hypothetical protein